MGAWGTGNFDNDDAQDWVFEVTESDSADVLEQALEPTTSDEYLEAPDCSIALAAADIIAAIHLDSLDELPDELRAWVEDHEIEVSTELVAMATAAVTRIRADSELQELWEDSDEYDDWLSIVSNLEANLAAG